MIFRPGTSRRKQGKVPSGLNASYPSSGESFEAPAVVRGLVHNTARPERFGSSRILIFSQTGDLECRCNQLQVLSRCFTLAGPGQSHLNKVTSLYFLIRIKQGGFVGLNALQGTSLRVRVLSGREHCKGTKTYYSHNDRHCRDQASVDFSLELFHKLARLQVR